MNTPYGSLGRVGPEVQPLSLNAEDYRAEINDFVFAGRLTGYMATTLIQLISATESNTTRPQATSLLIKLAKEELSEGIIINKQRRNRTDLFYYDVTVVAPFNTVINAHLFYLIPKFPWGVITHLEDL